jgi:hypothetical protein
MAVSDPGLFNFQQIMDDYHKMDPAEQDSEGRSYKLATAADMTSKAFDSQLAESMAQTQAALGKDMMTQQADLAMRNEGEARKQEFGYGMQSMGAQFDYQNTYANAQNSRDLGMLAATGQQDRMNIKESSNQSRLGDIVKGEQSRQNITTQGSQDRANIDRQGRVDVNKIGAQGSQDRANIGVQGQVDLSKIGSQGTQDRLNIGAQGDQDVRKIGAQGSEDRLNIGAQGDQEVRKIGAQGDDNRKTMDREDQITATRSNRQQARSRSLARSF